VAECTLVRVAGVVGVVGGVGRGGLPEAELADGGGVRGVQLCGFPHHPGVDLDTGLELDPGLVHGHEALGQSFKESAAFLEVSQGAPSHFILVHG